MEQQPAGSEKTPAKSQSPPGAARKRALDLTIKTVVVLAVVYHLSATYFQFHSSIQYLNTHLFFTLVLAGLSSLKQWPKLWPWWLLFIAASIVSTAYVELNRTALDLRSGFPTGPDMVIGVILIVLVLIACRWAFGLGVTLLVVVFLGYALFGFLVPGYFNTYPPRIPRLISQLSIGLAGIYGSLLTASAHYIFLFIIFGGILGVTVAVDVFIQIARVVARGTRGGAGHLAVVSSALIGTVTGAASANVAIAGVFTIPTMKKVGYSPEVAASYEAAASQGGQIMPPVLGAAAFVMSELTGISYFAICVAAFIPALLYFLSVGMAVEMRGRQMNLPVERTPAEFGKLFYALPLFVIPLGLLVVLLALRYTASHAALWAILAVLILAYLRKGTRPSWSKLLSGLENGVIAGVRIAASCAALGLLLAVMTGTGLGVKLPQFVEMGSQGNMWLALFLTLFISVVLGCGLPTLAAYIIVAIVAAPVLVNMGVPLLAAHLAVFYWAIYAGVTPPFAPTALVASGIAHSNYMRTCIEAIKVSFAGLILPFLWVTNSTLLAQFTNPVLVILTLVGAILMLIAMNAVFVGYYLVKVDLWERVLATLCALTLATAITVASYPLYVTGTFLFLVLTLWQFVKWKRALQTAGRQQSA